MRTFTYFLAIFLFPYFVVAQDSLWNDLEDNSSKVYATFKSLKIVNFESTKLASKKEFQFIVSHRFASIENGFDDFFGLDNAVTRLQVVYGINDFFNVGISRSSYQKVYDLLLKYKFVTQNDKIPFTIAGYNVIALNTFLDEDYDPNISFSDKFAFTAQVLISRKFNEKLSLELIPTFLYENYVFFENQENAQFIFGFGGRYKLSKRLSLNIDYGWHLNRASNSPYKNPLSIGVDIETGGHVFQLHFTNSQAMTESGYLGQAVGDWSDGNIFFGFNLVRVF